MTCKSTAVVYQGRRAQMSDGFSYQPTPYSWTNNTSFYTCCTSNKNQHQVLYLGEVNFWQTNIHSWDLSKTVAQESLAVISTTKVPVDRPLGCPLSASPVALSHIPWNSSHAVSLCCYSTEATWAPLAWRSFQHTRATSWRSPPSGMNNEHQNAFKSCPLT